MCLGDARTQSPPTKNCAPEAPTFGEIASFNRTKCNARSPPGGTALLITVPSVPGKLTVMLSNPFIYKCVVSSLVGPRAINKLIIYKRSRALLHNQKNTTCYRMYCPTGVYRDGMTIRYRPVGHYTSVPSFDFWLCIMSALLFPKLHEKLTPENVIESVSVFDIRFPTSLEAHGSDAMHKDPDYSNAYVVIHVRGLPHEGHGLTFTLGRGTDIVVSAIRGFLPLVIGQQLITIYKDFAAFWRKLTSETQLRWLGPEKGVVHLAVAAVVNGLWDLWGKVEGKPVWKLLSDMTPEEIVSLVDFRYLSDAITKDEALALLTKNVAGRAEREAKVREHGYPCYITSIGWLGYSSEKIRGLCKEAIEQGFRAFKMKVGQDVEDDVARAGIIREQIGWDRPLMMDANQRWDVQESIDYMTRLARFKPLWIEEPTSPDDVLGHAQIARALRPLGIKVATGEHCQNRVMFKQFLQAGAMDFCQIDSCRVGGVNEIIAILLMAAKLNVPVCPHAGGVGLCEYVQHLSLFDYVCVSGTQDGRMIEYSEHLHDHFVDGAVISRGNYVTPLKPGYSSEMKVESRDRYLYPGGPVWQELQAKSCAK